MRSSKGRSRLVRPPVSAPRLARATVATPARPPSAAWPVVKWVGGKTKLLPEIVTRFPRTFGRYFEPFAGGAAVFFHLGPEAAVLSDRNADLIGMYRAVASDPDGVIRRLTLHQAAHDSDHYYQTRARWNDRSVSWTTLDRAATFIYLNRTCFNGLWRVNKGGGFNVPMGRYKNPSICDVETIGRASTVLKRATLLCGDYQAAVADAGPGDLVYFDPPYDPVTPTANFTAYTGDGFGPTHQQELADTVRALAERGCAVVLSNSDTPLIRSLYRGLRVDRVKCPRAINSDPTRRGDVDEVLVLAGYQARAGKRAASKR
ncbi:MAG: DNA adenine methylase [Myxococcales bacterium]|nr:DNA adenine methylase [Myxococcales bacterium]